jgi:hypothetical protein
VNKITDIRTAGLLNLIVDRIRETIREGKPVEYIHLDSNERGIVAPVMVLRLEHGKRTRSVLGYEIRPGIGGVSVSG